MRRGIVTVSCILFTVGFVGIFVSPGRRWSMTCTRCGLQARCTSWPWTHRASAAPTDAELPAASTPLSRWYSANVGSPHEHRWIRGTCTYHLNLWGRGVGVGCNPSLAEPLAYEQAEIVEFLGRLADHGLDRSFYGLLSHESRDVRILAWQSRLGVDFHDGEAVKRWWSRLQDEATSEARRR